MLSINNNLMAANTATALTSHYGRLQTSTQRLMIDSKFQAMGDEIDHIARATDFNGVKLLCTKMITWYTDEERFVVTDPGSVSNLVLPAGNTGNPVLRNITATKYIDEANPAKKISVNLTAAAGIKSSTGNLQLKSVNGTTTEYTLGDTKFSATTVNALGDANNPVFIYDHGTWSVRDDNHYDDTPNTTIPPYGEPTFSTGGQRLVASAFDPDATVYFSLDDKESGRINLQTIEDTYKKEIAGITVDTGKNTYKIDRNIVEINADTADYTATYL